MIGVCKDREAFAMIAFFKIIRVLLILFIITACGKSDIEKSKELIATGMFPQAIELLKKKITENPEDAEAHFLLAVAFINTRKLEEGDELFADAVNLKSDYKSEIGGEYRAAGESALKMGNTDDAINLFQAAVGHQPDLRNNIARSVYEKGKELSNAGQNAQAIELHQYAVAHDPLLAADIGKWYAIKAEEVESAEERINLLLAASHFQTAYNQEVAKIKLATAREEAEKNAISVRARMQHVIDQRLDERAWQRLAVKSLKILGREETVHWSVKYYKKAGYDVKRLALNDNEWINIGRFANQSNMFFLSANDFWYLKSSSRRPQMLKAAITKAKGIQFYGAKYMDISLKTENPPDEVFYWISPKS